MPIVSPYPARLDSRELGALERLAYHLDTPPPLRDALNGIVRQEVKRRLWASNDEGPLEVQAAMIDASDWTMVDVVGSISCLHVQALALARQPDLRDTPSVELLHRLMMHLLVVATCKAKARAGQQTAEAPSGRVAS